MRDYEQLKTKYSVPEKLWNYTEFFMDENDWALIEACDEKGVVERENVTQDELVRGYSRGILNKYETGNEIGYRIAVFYNRIDTFIRGEKEKWYQLPEEVRRVVVENEQSMETWVVPYREEGKNQKIINPLLIEEAIEVIENATGKFYVQECDCRTYRENKGHMTRTCLHFPDSLINTNADRGYAEIISKEEALKIIKDTDKDGLIHNYGGNHFCNCCGECCWAVRGFDTYRDMGYDVYVEYVNARYVADITDKCVGCGRCVKQCPMKALTIKDKSSVVDRERCIGCGVCRAVCPVSAIEMQNRNEK